MGPVAHWWAQSPVGTGAGVLCNSQKAGLWGDLQVVPGQLCTLECVPLKPNRTHLVATTWPPLFLTA